MKKIIALVLVAMMVAAILCGCGLNEISSGVSKEPAKTDDVAKETDPTEAPADTEFTLNETAVFKTLKITATEMEESQGKEYFEPKDGNVFIGVKFTVENISDKEQNISSILLFDAYIDGVKCEYSVSANIAFDDGSLDGSIASGKKMIGWYCVEAAEDWEKLEIQVKSEWLSDTAATFVFENK